MPDEAMIEFIEASRKAGLELTPEDLADICWLAAQLRPGGGSGNWSAGETASLDEDVDSIPPAGERSGPESLGNDAPPANRGPVDPPWWASPSQPQTVAGELRPYTSAVAGHVPGVPFRTTGSSALSRAELSRALRPIKRLVPSRSEVEFDEAATVTQAAEGDLWLPMWISKLDRWLDLAVVVDDAASGWVWRSSVRAFVRSVEESGALRSIKVYRINTDEPGGKPLKVRGEGPASQGNRDPKELVDPAGQRAVLVMSDCVSTAWSDGRVAQLLNTWVVSGPVAVVHFLPHKLWYRCQARFVPVQWRSSRPTTSNHAIEWRPREHELGEPAPHMVGTVIPTVELTGRGLSRWATLVSGDTPTWVPGVALFAASPATYALRGSVRVATQDTANPTVRVARFRAVASPDAYRLVCLLAAAPLQLQVIRVVQQAMFERPKPAHIAEVVLSGLLERLTPDGPVADPELTEYDFQPGVRAVLLSFLDRATALSVLYEVGRFLNRRNGAGIDLFALLSPLSRESGGLGANRPFARVAAHVLRALGGTYADKASYLETNIVEPDENSQSGVTDVEVSSAFGPGQPDRPSDTLSRKDDVVTRPGQLSTPFEQQQESSRATIWEVPRRTPHFTGRKELLTTLRAELLNSPKAAVLVPRALYGLGGVGKTALANEYAWAYGFAYDVVWWIPAEDPADVRRSLVVLGERLKLPETLDVAQAVSNVLRALVEGRPKDRWLLIFDNANDPEELRPYLPEPTSRGHVLVTSRDERWATEGRPLAVDIFTRQESIALLRRRAPQLSESDADHLAGEVNDLPLAVNQAAAWHAETGLSVDDYLTLYNAKLDTLRGVDLPSGYPTSVAATFGVSYDHLSGRSLAAAQLLQLCSHFGPEPISVDMLWRGRYVENIPKPLDRIILDRSGVKRQLREIDSYELVRLDQGRDRFQLHRLVQVILRTALSKEQRYTRAGHAQRILALANPGTPDDLDFKDRMRHAELSPHIVPSGALLAEDREVRTVVLDQIRYRYLAGDYLGCQELAKEVVGIWLERFPNTDEQTLVARRHYANALRAVGEPRQALEIDQDVLALFTNTLGEDHEHSLTTANSLAADLRAVGEFYQARDLDRQNLERHRRILRDDDPSTLRTANNYAVDLRLLGEFERAEALDRETIGLRTAGYGAEHPSTLFAISNLARDIYGLGRYGEALTIQQDAIAIHEAVLGTGHPEVMLARRTIAVVLRKLGRYARARELAQANYESYRTRFGERHEFTLAAMMSLGNALREENADRDAMRQAEDLMGEALALYQSYFPGHPFVEVCATNYAIVLRQAGKVAQAREQNTAALQSLKVKLSERHPYALCCAVNLSNDMAAGRDYEAAYALSLSTLAFSREVRGESHPYTLACANNHAINAQMTDHEDDQSAGATVAKRIATVLGADHPDTMAAREGRRIDADIEPPPT